MWLEITERSRWWQWGLPKNRDELEPGQSVQILHEEIYDGPIVAFALLARG